MDGITWLARRLSVAPIERLKLFSADWQGWRLGGYRYAHIKSEGSLEGTRVKGK